MRYFLQLRRGAVISAEAITVEAYDKLENEKMPGTGFGTAWFAIEADTEAVAIQVTEKVVRLLWNDEFAGAH